MFKQKCVILMIFVGVMFTLSVAVKLALPSMAFAAEKTDKDAIMEELRGFVDKNPTILRGVIFSMADEYIRQNKVDEAIVLFEKALKVMPDNEDFLSRLGDLYNQKGDYQKVIDVYKKMTELRPDNVLYFKRLSDAYRNAKDNKDAEGVWQGLMKTSNNPEVFVQASNFYNSQNDMDKAIEAMKKATELASNNIRYLRNLESFYVRLGKFAEAKEVISRISKISKDHWIQDWIDSQLINISQKQGKLNELGSVFEKDLANNPSDLRQYRKLGDLYQRSSQPDKAIEVYEKAVAAGIGNRDINNRLMDLYERLSLFDKAERQIKEVIKMAPKDAYLYERLANLLDRAGKRDEAKKAWQDFLQRVPKDAGAFSKFGDKLSSWGDVDGAIEQYKKAQLLDSRNLWYTIRLADMLISKKRFSEARVELEEMIKKASDEVMKREAQRRLKYIENKLKVKAGLAKPVLQPPTSPVPVKASTSPALKHGGAQQKKVKQTATPKQKPKKKKRKGWWFER